MNTTANDAVTFATADDAVAKWAETYACMWDLADGFHSSLCLSEAKALADLLAVAGEPNLALILINEWAHNDPESAEENEDRLELVRQSYRDHPDFDPSDTRGIR